MYGIQPKIIILPIPPLPLTPLPNSANHVLPHQSDRAQSSNRYAGKAHRESGKHLTIDDWNVPLP
jgi:hypothetical protein